MASIIRVKAKWSGFSGAPGYSVFHFRDFSAGEPTNADATAATARLKTFFEAWKILVPTGASIQIESDVEVIEETTGQLTTVLAATPVAVVSGAASAAATFASAVGAVVTWRTPGIRNGRRIRGRTFLVPLSSTAFQNDGTLASSTVGTVGSAAAALIDSAGTPDLGVYARPTGPGATDGIWYAVTSYSIPDMGAVLRSRRD